TRFAQDSSVPRALLSIQNAYPSASTVPELSRNTVRCPHPSATTCTWKPSSTPCLPTLPCTNQALPLTSTQESTCRSRTAPSPESLLSRSTPPVVPSLTSTFSAVVPAMSLPSTTFLSLRSGSHAQYLHQLLRALP